MNVWTGNRCEICETDSEPLYACDIGPIPRGGLYFCGTHFMEHLRDAHKWGGEEAAVEYAKRRALAARTAGP